MKLNIWSTNRNHVKSCKFWDFIQPFLRPSAADLLNLLQFDYALCLLQRKNFGILFRTGVLVGQHYGRRLVLSFASLCSLRSLRVNREPYATVHQFAQYQYLTHKPCAVAVRWLCGGCALLLLRLKKSVSSACRQIYLVIIV